MRRRSRLCDLGMHAPRGQKDGVKVPGAGLAGLFEDQKGRCEERGVSSVEIRRSVGPRCVGPQRPGFIPGSERRRRAGSVHLLCGEGAVRREG